MEWQNIIHAADFDDDDGWLDRDHLPIRWSKGDWQQTQTILSVCTFLPLLCEVINYMLTSSLQQMWTSHIDCKRVQLIFNIGGQWTATKRGDKFFHAMEDDADQEAWRMQRKGPTISLRAPYALELHTEAFGAFVQTPTDWTTLFNGCPLHKKDQFL